MSASAPSLPAPERHESLLLVAAQWPSYWLWIASEHTPMTTLEVCMMFTTGLVFFATGTLLWLHHGSSAASRWWQCSRLFFAYDFPSRPARCRMRDDNQAPRRRV